MRRCSRAAAKTCIGGWRVKSLKNFPVSRTRVPKFSHATGRRRGKPNQRSPNGQGRATPQRRATRFREARESYQQGLALLEQLPESTGRDLSELELRQAVIRMLWVTGWYSTPETIEATERAAMVAERSGNLAQLVYW